MKILLTGGCGFIGTVLTGLLLKDGHDVCVVDNQWFGNHLAAHPRLTVLQQDTRDVDAIPLDGVEVVLHLANIANDPGVELNPTLSWEVNVLATQQLADRAVRAGVKHFMFASSGSVYGVKDEPQVTEDLSLVPISAYNKTKMVAERVVLSYADHMQVHCIRPATVCGFSPRMRLDVSVNMFTWQALQNGRITVFGGTQTRPNIHIQDMVNVYRHFITQPDIASGCYNAGFENISILDIAERVRSKIPAELVVSESNDPRSYRQNSDKLLATGFVQGHTVNDAIDDIIAMHRSGAIKESDQCYTVRWMKHLNLQS
ncbi:SDR family oxidoreductase [Herbaspirillum sp. RTI4]|uniref:NAD-dependent epimerase/dehydratase family protein n=1 Tax=Herbaspirillum sp. RTI4 TaxID=3048640 RepID=UPI002AB542A4|nr:SDR family oxidoreductase [Herbaspirillum sp. RTI4]MDY7577025.1 SDR family oxidoreductase [Herbaspirillum sp. RTI4]MEA9983096.1 SDR family oxidoreductase [Herbaspirillum sp. RTI4]